MDNLQHLPVPEVIKTSKDYTPSLVLEVIIVVHNPTSELEDCLESLLGQHDQHFSTILVDNGSFIPSYIEKYPLKYVKLDKNYGPSVARNIGVTLSQAKIVAFLDDDGIADPNWTRNIVTHLTKTKVLGLRGKILPKSKHNIFNLLAYHYDLGEESFPANLDTEGNSAVLNKNLLMAGGFTDHLFGHEGSDLAKRLEQLFPNHQILYTPDVILHHDYSDSLSHYLDKRFRQGKNNAFKHTTQLPTSYPVRQPLPKRSKKQTLQLLLLERLGYFMELGGKLTGLVKSS